MRLGRPCSPNPAFVPVGTQQLIAFSAFAGYPLSAISSPVAPPCSVFFSPRVPVNAGFAAFGDPDRVLAPESVFEISDRLKMSGIHASPVAAKVVNVQSSRNRADE